MGLRSNLTRALVDYDDQNSIASRLRRKRVWLLHVLIEQALKQHTFVRILDLGGTEGYWRILPSELLYSGSLHITLVNIHVPPSTPFESSPFTYLCGDACALKGIDDNTFDIVHSNSVIEHVGSWRRMKAFAGEVRRLAPRYYVQTPNFWFPIEPHFVAPAFHWLPVPLRACILTKTGLGHYERAADIDKACSAVEGINLVGTAQFRYLFPDSEIKKERLFGIAKSLIAIRMPH